MRAILTTLIILATTCFLSAGTFADTTADGGAIRALVVGISDYRSDEIPDLQYAHRDAPAFAGWLRSPAGGEVPAENLRLLTGEQATGGAILAGLHWLLTESRKGDRAVVYFSGHAGLESVANPQPGYLLPYDAPGMVYPAGGIGQGDLRRIFSHIKDIRQAEVWFILDAPHVEALPAEEDNAPSPVRDLAGAFPVTVKMLACGPGQVAAEGNQWGNGHSRFTYSLLQGLYGAADSDGNGEVLLPEIQDYLQLQMSGGAAPQPAIVEGDARLRLSHPQGMTAPPGVALQSYAPPAGADADPRLAAFQRALSAGQLLEPAGQSAYDFLRQAAGLKPETLQRARQQLAGALLARAQEGIPDYLNHNPVAGYRGSQPGESFRSLARYAETAVQLLSGNAIVANLAGGREAFLEGLALRLEAGGEAAESDYNESLARLNQAMTTEEGAHVYNEIGNAYLGQEAYDRALLHFRKGMNMSPKWTPPYLNAARCYLLMNRAADGLLIGQQAIEMAPENPGGYLVLGQLYQKLRRFEEAEQVYQKALELDPRSAPAQTQLGALYAEQGQYGKAETALQKAISIDRQHLEAHLRLAELYRQWNKPEKGIQTARQLIQIAPEYLPAQLLLGRLYMENSRYEEAEQQLLQALSLEPSGSAVLRYLGRLYQEQEKPEQALGYYEQAIEADEEDPLTYLWMGSLYEYSKKQPEVAENLYRRAIDVAPQRPEGYVYLGRLLREQGQLDDAARQFQRALEIEPGYLAAQNGLGLVYRRQGQYQRAEAQFKQIIQEAPNDPTAFYNLGLLYHENLQRYSDAEQQYRQALNIAPLNPAYHSALSQLYREMGREEAANAQLQQAIELGLSDARTLYNAGITALTSGNTAEAESFFRQVLEVEPANPRAHYQLGKLLRQQGAQGEAARLLQRATELDDDFAPAFYELGALYQHLGQPEKAENLFQALLQRQPEATQVRYALALLYYQQGKDREAVPHLQRILANEPNHVEALNLAGAVYMRLNNAAKAKELYQRVLDLEPDHAPAHYNLGVLYRQEGDLSQAAELLSRATELDADNPDNFYQLGIVYQQQSKYPEAAEAWEKALEGSPGDEEMLNDLTRLYLYDLKRYDKAEDRAQTILRQDPKDVEARRMLGYAILYDGQPQRARQHFEQLLQQEPDNPRHYYSMAAFYSYQEEKKEAYEWLEKALQRGFRNTDLLREDPDLNNIRDSRRFRKLVVDYLEEG